MTSQSVTDQPESIEGRMARLERLVRGQQDVIARQQERIAQLEGRQAAAPAVSAAPAGATTPAMEHPPLSGSRRTLLKLGGAAAAAGVAAAAVGATHAGTAQAHFMTAGVFTDTGPGHIACSGTGSGGAIGVEGVSDSTFGVYAQSSSGTALQGQSTNGNGTVGNSINLNGITGNSTNQYGGAFTGGLAPIYLTPSASLGSGPPASGAHQKGELYVDALGALWYCTVGGTSGSWIRLAGPQAGSPGGALNYLAAPIRLFDTRPGSAPLPVTKAPLAGQSSLTIQVT
ncbi:MAG TPA: hypothetical protein VGR57_04235, partial [Ktedonobacterales bacterium]|nr:hypothetical protein [Ktedonobacterales bacterium]